MKKAEFIELVQSFGGYTKKAEAEKAINSFIEAVSVALEKKESVQLVGFGTFSSEYQKAKSGKIPGTDKMYTTEAKYVPKFKAGKGLKDRVSAGK